MRNALRIVAGMLGFSMVCANTIAEEGPAPTLSTEFAVKLYQKLAEQKGNIFVSPISIQSALAMTAEGAKGNTQKQLLDVLSIGKLEEFAKSVEALRDAPPGLENAEPMQLNIINGVYVQNAYPLRDEFIDLVGGRHRAQASSFNPDEPEQARRMINDTVMKFTSGKITDLVPEGVIDARTRLVLVNGVHFRGQWAEQFSADATKKGGFMVAQDNQVGVGMMHQVARFGHAETDAYHMVSFPYAGATASMVLVVPKQVDGLAKVEKSLDAKALGEQIRKLETRKIALSMPQFKVVQSVALADALKAMGITDAFSDKADFSGMTTAEKLQISAVVHQAVIEVDEKGTEASAATAVAIGVTSMPQPEEPLQITLDRPFMFLIVDKRTGAVLFIGRLANPNA